MSDASMVVSPLRPRVIEPGLPALDPGVERYVVQGGGAIAVAVEPGDVLEIVDLEGRQAAELVLFSPTGREDAGAIGARAAHEPTGLRRILSQQSEDARRVRAALDRRGLDLGRARALRRFGGDSPPGEHARFHADREAFVLVAAPGGPMAIDQQDPPTDLLVFLRRAVIKAPASARLPEPLAEPRLDFRVGIASALEYEVRAGEYIQIIDVAGRQCSDFVAF